MTVLVLTCEEDLTADIVVATLQDLGVPLVRLDPADLPGRVSCRRSTPRTTSTDISNPANAW